MTAAKMLKILFTNNLIWCTRYSDQTQHTNCTRISIEPLSTDQTYIHFLPET